MSLLAGFIIAIFLANCSGQNGNANDDYYPFNFDLRDYYNLENPIRYNGRNSYATQRFFGRSPPIATLWMGRAGGSAQENDGTSGEENYPQARVSPTPPPFYGSNYTFPPNPYYYLPYPPYPSYPSYPYPYYYYPNNFGGFFYPSTTLPEQ